MTPKDIAELWKREGRHIGRSFSARYLSDHYNIQDLQRCHGAIARLRAEGLIYHARYMRRGWYRWKEE